MQRRRIIPLALLVALALSAFALHPPSLHAQKKGEPGQFDFYLLDMPWGPEFCSIASVSPRCKPQRTFVVHGLWAQNNDGSYPVFCSDEPGPLDPQKNLNLTPDLALLQHEWAKHGTCSDLGPKRFFSLERDAFYSLQIPTLFDHIDHELTLTPNAILEAFYKANPQMPEGSLLVGCKDDRLTAVEACFTRSLKPMPCPGLNSCTQPKLRIAPSPRP